MNYSSCNSCNLCNQWYTYGVHKRKSGEIIPRSVFLFIHLTVILFCKGFPATPSVKTAILRCFKGSKRKNPCPFCIWIRGTNPITYFSIPKHIFQKNFIQSWDTHCAEIPWATTGLHYRIINRSYPQFVNISDYELQIQKSIFVFVR